MEYRFSTYAQARLSLWTGVLTGVVFIFFLIFYLNVTAGRDRAIGISIFSLATVLSVSCIAYSYFLQKEVEINDKELVFRQTKSGKSTVKKFIFSEITLEEDIWGINFFIVSKSGDRIKMTSEFRIEADNLSQEQRQRYEELDVIPKYKSLIFLKNLLKEKLS